MKRSSGCANKTLFIFALVQVTRTTAVDDVCREANDVLIANDDVTSSFIAMIEDFNDNCGGEQCQYNVDPVTSDLTQNWDALSSLTLSAMTTACQFFSLRRVCEVTSEVEFTNLVEIDGVTVFTDIIEEKRPICFPPTCSESEISTVHSSPAGCNPGDSNCEVISQSVDCPSRPTSSGNCADDVLSSTHLFNTLQTVFQGNILLNCQEALDSGDTDLCSLNIAQVEVAVDYSYEDFLDESETTVHRELCQNAGGQECLVDVNASFPTNLEYLELDVTDLDVGDLSVEGRFTKIPVCLPLSCSDEDLNTLAQEYFLLNVEDIAGATCGESDIPCSAEITNVACNGLSSTPTFQPSNLPSSVPLTNHPSAFPSKTMMPTLSSSQNPSSSPSTGSSSQPSFESSSFPTESPTISPTTSAPTQSSYPSLKPSSLPTQNSSVSCRALHRLIRSFLRAFH